MSVFPYMQGYEGVFCLASSNNIKHSPVLLLLPLPPLATLYLAPLSSHCLHHGASRYIYNHHFALYLFVDIVHSYPPPPLFWNSIPGGDDRTGQGDVRSKTPEIGRTERYLRIGNHARHHRRHQNVEHRTHDQRTDDPDGHVGLRISCFFGVGRDRIEADIREEDHAGGAEHAGPAVGHEGRPIARVDVADARHDHENHRRDLDQDHQGIEAAALTYSDDQHCGDNGRNRDGNDIECQMDPAEHQWGRRYAS